MPFWLNSNKRGGLGLRSVCPDEHVLQKLNTQAAFIPGWRPKSSYKIPITYFMSFAISMKDQYPAQNSTI